MLNLKLFLRHLELILVLIKVVKLYFLWCAFIFTHLSYYQTSEPHIITKAQTDPFVSLSSLSLCHSDFFVREPRSFNNDTTSVIFLIFCRNLLTILKMTTNFWFRSVRKKVMLGCYVGVLIECQRLVSNLWLTANAWIGNQRAEIRSACVVRKKQNAAFAHNKQHNTVDRDTFTAAAMWQPGQILCQKGQFFSVLIIGCYVEVKIHLFYILYINWE